MLPTIGDACITMPDKNQYVIEIDAIVLDRPDFFVALEDAFNNLPATQIQDYQRATGPLARTANAVEVVSTIEQQCLMIMALIKAKMGDTEEMKAVPSEDIEAMAKDLEIFCRYSPAGLDSLRAWYLASGKQNDQAFFKGSHDKRNDYIVYAVICFPELARELFFQIKDPELSKYLRDKKLVQVLSGIDRFLFQEEIAMMNQMRMMNRMNSADKKNCRL